MDKLICKICNQKCSNYKSLSNHITKYHKLTSLDYYNTYLKTESEGSCKVCGKPTNFKNLKLGYRVYCSNECSRKDVDVYQKIQKTNIEKYGSTCTLANKDIQEKAHQTKLEKYGSRYYSNKEKAKETNELKTFEKYKNDIIDCNILNYKNSNFECYCKKCNNNFIITESLAYLRHYRYNMPLCTICNPVDSFYSNGEKEILNYIKELLTMEQDKLICKICNQEFAKIDCVGRHVKRMHGIEPQQYYDTYFKSENEGKCKCCGIDTKYYNLETGYRGFCSRACFWKYTNNQQETKDKRKQTCLEKYGSLNYMQTQEFKDKSKETNLKLYGVENAGGSVDSVNKIKQTKLERYGDENFNNCNKEIKESETLEKFKKLCSDIDILSYTDKIFKCKCKTCNNEFTMHYQTLCNRLFTFKTKICPICNPLNTFYSNAEISVANYIKPYVNIIENDRTILSGHELDIYIPEKKLAFEYDGLYWHNELFKDKNYHLNKTIECEKQGIQLIHIFEDEWLYKQDIVKSRIKGLLGLNERIFARKCIIKEVSYKDSEEFLNRCHIQGNCMSTYRYGLYYEDQLVSLMTFGKSRFKNDEYELLRFCNELNLNVVGGASKLFKHFLNDHPEITKIISFADRRWSIGNLYEKLGFTDKTTVTPAYFYVIDGIRHNRMEFQKHKLIKEGFDSNLSEHEIMLQQKIYRIYDCGNLKYSYNK